MRPVIEIVDAVREAQEAARRAVREDDGRLQLLVTHMHQLAGFHERAATMFDNVEKESAQQQTASADFTRLLHACGEVLHKMEQVVGEPSTFVGLDAKLDITSELASLAEIIAVAWDELPTVVQERVRVACLGIKWPE